MTTTKTRIAFVDDHPAMLQGLISLFSKNSDYDIVATGASACDAWKITEAHKPDILFMDLSMPGNVYSVIEDISQHLEETKVVVCTAFSSVDSAMRALDAGASGFVLKTSGADEFYAAANSVHRGDLFITGEYASQVMRGLRNRKQQEPAGASVKLSVREQQIVDLLHDAHTNREIAATLAISEKTVKRYMTTLMQKLHARNRVEVAVRHTS
jgi:two-component system, NarL family, nitrate/nitrite response regulator NarL